MNVASTKDIDIAVETILYIVQYKLTELGTRQFCRDNVTMFSGQNVVMYLLQHYCICLSIPSGHRDKNFVHSFSTQQKHKYPKYLIKRKDTRVWVFSNLPSIGT